MTITPSQSPLSQSRFAEIPPTKRSLRTLACLGLAVAVSAAAGAAEQAVALFNNATPLEWSKRMADSEMARRGSTMFYQGSERARWDYTTSLFGLSLMKLTE